jgi:hypothetical protein
VRCLSGHLRHERHLVPGTSSAPLNEAMASVATLTRNRLMKLYSEPMYLTNPQGLHQR